jgi:hypothetical protein
VQREDGVSLLIRNLPRDATSDDIMVGAPGARLIPTRELTALAFNALSTPFQRLIPADAKS